MNIFPPCVFLSSPPHPRVVGLESGVTQALPEVEIGPRILSLEVLPPNDVAGNAFLIHFVSVIIVAEKKISASVGPH